MSDDRAPPILPTVGDVVGPAKARLAIVRPTAAQHIEKGNYSVPFTAWRGQFTRIRARLAAEVKAAFLQSSQGEALSQLAAMRFDTPRATTGATAALGAVTLARRVIHYLPSAATVVTADDATTSTTLAALLANIRSVFNTHGASVYASGTCLGAHLNAESLTMDAPVTTTMADIVTTLTQYKNYCNLHFSKPTFLQIVNGVPFVHAFPDLTSTIATAAAFASDGATAFSAQTLASQQSALALANAIKKALNAHVALRAPAGTIAEGTKFRVASDPAATPPVTGGEYAVTQNTYVRTGAASITAPVRALTPGLVANLPAFDPARTFVLSATGSLYDAAETLRFVPTTITAAGGSEGQSDPLLRQAAAANWQGSYGPTERAIVAGTLRFPGLARCPLIRDSAAGSTVFYAVDGSWAQSTEWLNAIEQHLKTDWLGVGCLLSQGSVTNRVVRVELSVVLRERRDLADTSAITAALQATVADYFEKRPDFWIFRLAGLRAACSRAHRKILKCADAVVLDPDGSPIAEPAQPAAGAALTHWWFAGGLDVVFDASG